MFISQLKKTWRRSLLAAGLTLSLTALSFGGGTAAAAPFKLAPVNPDFLQYSQQLPSESPENSNKTHHPTSGRPSPANLKHLQGKLPSIVSTAGTLPSRYDLRESGKLSSVRDQGDCGSCWAFGSLASLESCQLPLYPRDYSEQNMITQHGYDWGPCEGGNTLMAAAYLGRWGGPVTETADPYNPANPLPVFAAPDRHLQEAWFLFGSENPAANTQIKQAIVNFGAVASMMYYDNTCYNPDNCSYFYNGYPAVNHGVSIVGWDDNFDRSRFNAENLPPGNGAFIVKNSWGEAWGEAGYFYVSYYDSSLAKVENTLFHGSEAVSNYAGMYQYDELGLVGMLGDGATETAWCANVFTAFDSHPLQAIGFYALSPGTDYTAAIYLDPLDSVPNSGTPVAEFTGTLALPGYHTVDLPAPVQLQAGQKFSVVLQLTTPGYPFPIPAEFPWPGFSSAASAEPGESFFSMEGLYWFDTDCSPDILGIDNLNVCLKAYTVDPDSSAGKGRAQLNIKIEDATKPSNDNASLSGRVAWQPGDTLPTGSLAFRSQSAQTMAVTTALRQLVIEPGNSRPGDESLLLRGPAQGQVGGEEVAQMEIRCGLGGSQRNNQQWVEIWLYDQSENVLYHQDGAVRQGSLQIFPAAGF